MCLDKEHDLASEPNVALWRVFGSTELLLQLALEPNVLARSVHNRFLSNMDPVLLSAWPVGLLLAVQSFRRNWYLSHICFSELLDNLSACFLAAMLFAQLVLEPHGYVLAF